jgi:integrase
MKLTNRTVAGLTLDTSESERIVWDDDIPGLGLRMRAGGSRNWVFQYKIGAKHRRMTLGALSAVPLIKARELAGDLYAQVRLGQDPAAIKAVNKSRAAETCEPIARRFLAQKKKTASSSYYLDMERHLLVNAKPLHGLSVTGIQRRDIADLLSSLRERHSDITADHVRASLSGFFTWAMKEGLVETNPTTGTNRTPAKARDRVLSSEELRTIWAALRDDTCGDLVRLLMLTGQRCDEFGSLCHSEIDFNKSLIVLPPGRTKNKLEHVLPMSDAVATILKGRKRIVGRDLVFGTGKGGYSGWSTAKKDLDGRLLEARRKTFGRKAQPMPAWRLHDIRRSVATGMAVIGILPHVIEAVLNHISGHKAGVAGIYNRATYLPEKTAALNTWATHLMTVVGA